jgi:hypothetical protein
VEYASPALLMVLPAPVVVGQMLARIRSIVDVAVTQPYAQAHYLRLLASWVGSDRTLAR